MRILIVSYYFPPDLCAGSFRVHALAEALLANKENIQLDIVTTEPNRYQSYQPDAEMGFSSSLNVARARLPNNRFGLSGQIRSFLYFALFARRKTASRKYDLVIATSSRLMTAVLGAYLARKVGAKLYLDIRDVFVETVSDVFPTALLGPVRWMFDKCERWAMRRADRVNLVTRGFLPYFKKRYGRLDYRFFTNGVDEEFAKLLEHPTAQLPNVGTDRRLNVVYAGNIGEGQGLEQIIPELALRINDAAKFIVVGDGGTRSKLINRCQQLAAPVEFVDAVPRSELLEIYLSADVLFLHLNDLPAFRRVLPSKLFEYAALGKPILAGVKGYARVFIEAEVEGVGIFDPCDVDGAESAFRHLSLRVFRRDEFVQVYLRSHIMRNMANDAIDLAKLGHDV